MRENFRVKGSRNFANSDRPGSYRLASVLRESVLDPGGTIEIDQFITGYGECSGLKITFYPSNKLFVEEESFFEHGLQLTKDNPPKVIWGGTVATISNEGTSINPIMKNDGCGGYSAVFDIRENSNFIFTERRSPKAPFSYRLKLKRDSTSGPHYINFYLTFYNGNEWVCQEERVNFKINNMFETHSTKLSWIAAIALLVTIAHDGLSPILDSLHEVGKWIELIHHS